MTHRNLTSSSLNDISDKPEKDQVSRDFSSLKLKTDHVSKRCWVGLEIVGVTTKMDIMCRQEFALFSKEESKMYGDQRRYQ